MEREKKEMKKRSIEANEMSFVRQRLRGGKRDREEVERKQGDD